jgi:2-dehydropantoate 2-reductase
MGHRLPRFNGAAAEQWADADRPATRDALDTLLTPTSASARNWRASMAQDVAKGRPTEIDEMNGHVVAEGRRRGVATPVSSAVVEVVHEVEAGVRQAAPQNLELVLRRAGG